jgi:hypothetical protein
MRLDVVNFDLVKCYFLGSKYRRPESDPHTKKAGAGTVWLNAYSPQALQLLSRPALTVETCSSTVLPSNSVTDIFGVTQIGSIFTRC